MEIKNIPEIQEQDAAEKLSSLYLNSIEGDREENIKAISAAVTVKYLESLNSLEGVNTSVVFDPKSSAEEIRRVYSGVSKVLIEGAVINGQEIRPSDTWLLNQTLKMKTFDEAIDVIDSVSDAETINLIVDTIKQIDFSKLSGVEKASDAMSVGLELVGPKLSHKNYNAIIQEIESLIQQKNDEMLEVGRSKDVKEDIIYMASRCVDYAVLTYPARVLRRLDLNIKSSSGKEVLESLASEFSSLGHATLNSIFHDENPDFMNDVTNILIQNASLGLGDLIRIQHSIEQGYKE